MEFSTTKIARWLRSYRDWRAELDEPPGPVGSKDPSRLPGRGGIGAGSGGPTAGAALRQTDLARRVATVEQWLQTMTPGERIAAEYWLADDEGTFTAVAAALEIDVRRAKWLVMSIPLIIWLRWYKKRVDTNACSG